MTSADVKAMQLARAERVASNLPREFARRFLLAMTIPEFDKIGEELDQTGYHWAVRSRPGSICIFPKGLDPFDYHWFTRTELGID